MAIMPVKRIPSKDIIIMPPQKGDVRYGMRTAHEHDMNDAISARLAWFDQMKHREELNKEHAIHKAVVKAKDEREKEEVSKKMAIVFLIVFAIAAIGIFKFFHG